MRAKAEFKSRFSLSLLKKAISVLCCFIPFYGASQNFQVFGSKRAPVELGVPLDSSRLEMIYVMNVYDPVINDNRDFVRIMQIGDSAKRDGDYGTFRIDSVLWVIHEPQMLIKDYAQIHFGYGMTKGGKSFDTYDFDGHRWRDVDIVQSLTKGWVCAYDTTATQEWRLLDETTSMLGLECRKAICNFRGREWSVWYAPSVPLSGGPWKLGGLPGLILKAESSDKEFNMEAQIIRHGSGLILRKPVNCTELTREKMAALSRDYNEYKKRAWQEESPVIGGGAEIDERSFYNPIEKSLD